MKDVEIVSYMLRNKKRKEAQQTGTAFQSKRLIFGKKKILPFMCTIDVNCEKRVR